MWLTHAPIFAHVLKEREDLDYRRWVDGHPVPWPGKVSMPTCSSQQIQIATDLSPSATVHQSLEQRAQELTLRQFQNKNVHALRSSGQQIQQIQQTASIKLPPRHDIHCQGSEMQRDMQWKTHQCTRAAHPRRCQNRNLRRSADSTRDKCVLGWQTCAARFRGGP